MANWVEQLVTEALTDVAAGAVDRVVITTNVGQMVLTKPIPVASEDVEVPSQPGVLTRLLQPQVDVYLVGSTKAAVTYTPYGPPDPKSPKGRAVSLGALGLLVGAGYLMYRGATR